MYWWTNMMQRFHVLSAKKWFVRDNPEAQGYTTEDIRKMGVTNLSKKLVGYTSRIPGSRGSKSRLRRIIFAMGRQLEIETRTEFHRGDIFGLFGTLTSNRYECDGIIKIICEIEGIRDYRGLSKAKRRDFVNKYPLFVSWYCALRLELNLKANIVPNSGASAYVAVYEWSPTGGMVHLHYVLCVPGAPRFDDRAEILKARAAELRQGASTKGVEQACDISDILEFFSKYVNEWNLNKDDNGHELVDG